jgi:hypothetical protein
MIMRNMRGRAKANAKVSSELAGLDTSREETEFLEEVAASEANTSSATSSSKSIRLSNSLVASGPVEENKIPE